MNLITPVENTNNIRYADFVRVTTTQQVNAGSFVIGTIYTILTIGTTDYTLIGAASNTVGISFTATGAGTGTGVATTPIYYRFSTAPYEITVPEVDSQPFDGLGVLVSIGNASRDIKSTANETSITLVGIDTALLGWVLGHNIKGSKVEMWHGFFDENNQLIDDNAYGGLYQFFMGYISSFAISEQWDEDGKSFLGTISIACSSVQLILQNRAAGRFTNDNAWQFFNPGDTSMNRVAFIQSLNYPFGKDAPNNS